MIFIRLIEKKSEFFLVQDMKALATFVQKREVLENFDPTN